MNEFDDLVASDRMKRLFFALCHDLNLNAEQAKERVKAKYQLDSFANVTTKQLDAVIASLNETINQKVIIPALEAFFNTLPKKSELVEDGLLPEGTTYPAWLAKHMIKYFEIKLKE